MSAERPAPPTRRSDPDPVTDGAREVSAFDAFEAAGWEDAAESYERFFGPITGRLIGPILDTTGVAPGTRLLDVACGPGHLTARAADRGAQATGIDVATSMVSIARTAHPGIEFRHGDAHRLPFPAATFDVVTANFAILHLSEPERAVAEFARVLAPTGRVAVTVWDLPEHARLFGWILDALTHAGAEPPGDIPTGPAFFRFAVDQELATLLNSNGFERVAVRTITFTYPAVSSDDIWNGIVGGSVRTAALIRRQPVDVQRGIREAFDDVVSRACPRGQIEIPFSVKFATATTPAA